MSPISEIVAGICSFFSKPCVQGIRDDFERVRHDFRSSDGKPELARPILLECRHGSYYDPPECGL
jgi:hypothetical protein